MREIERIQLLDKINATYTARDYVEKAKKDSPDCLKKHLYKIAERLTIEAEAAHKEYVEACKLLEKTS